MGKLLLVWTIFVGAILVGLLWVAPASAQTIYSWETEDGGYAFTDDPEAIPARYRDRVRTRASANLRDYARYTEPVPGSGERYAEQLAARLEYLREFNAAPPAAETGEAAAPSAPRISLRTGSDAAPTLDVTPERGEGPLVVETLYTRPRGKMVTRQSLVVRQGDRTLAVVRPRSVETNTTEIVDEGEPLR
jgi:hypothetical protein